MKKTALTLGLLAAFVGFSATVSGSALAQGRDADRNLTPLQERHNVNPTLPYIR